jgi:formylglycine-generating enzyme required for sulfatase activity
MMFVMATRKGKRVAIAAGAVALVVIAVAVFLGWKHVVFYYRFAPLGVNAQGYSEYRHRQTGIVMVLLPGGKFLMGAQKTDPNGPNYDPEAAEEEGPVHEVTLSPFMIAKYEVNQAQWTTIMGSNPTCYKGDDNRPVDSVSWDDIQYFETKTGLSLPSEAQWEYACRGGSTTSISGTGNLDDMSWYVMNANDSTHPVGTKAPNGFGLYDTHGNVWEWCEDFYDADFYKKPKASETDPLSDTISDFRVYRGGSCGNNSAGCRSSDRNSYFPDSRACHVGFRVSAPAP